MKLLDIINAPWAILSDHLLEIQNLYLAHTRREKIDFKQWEAASGQPSGAVPDPYQVIDGVAVLDVIGVLTKSPSVWNRFCGMSSTAQIQQDLQAALKDPLVNSILLYIDSPGGMVDGTQELADAIFQARGQKPVVALASGSACSAAYWIAAAAGSIFISSDTTYTGSIGVITNHVDISKSEEAIGIKTTPLFSGKYKATGHQFGPLSGEDAAIIQGRLDYIYTIFVESISKYRAVSVDTVLANMAEGRVFVGQQAINAGLVDGVSTYDAMLARMAQGDVPQRQGAGAASFSLNPPIQEDIMTITREQLAAQAPELLTALVSEGKALGVQEGADAERARIQGCLKATLPGHEDLAQSFAFDGKTSPGDAALAINQAEREFLAKTRKDLDNSAPTPAPGGGDPLALEAAKARAQADDQAKKNDDPKAAWDSDSELRASFGNDFTAYEAYTKAESSGQVRILGQKK